MANSIKLEIDCAKLCTILQSCVSAVDPNINVIWQCKCENEKVDSQLGSFPSGSLISPRLGGKSDQCLVNNDALFPPPPWIEPTSSERLGGSDKENGDEVENVLVQVESTSPKEFNVGEPEYCVGIGKGGVPVSIVRHPNIRYKRVSLVTCWDLYEDMEAANYPLFAVMEDLVLANGDNVTITSVTPNVVANTLCHGTLFQANNEDVMQQVVVYAQPLRVQTALNKLHQDMQKVYAGEHGECDKLPPGKILIPGCAVVSHYEGEWYRAVVLKEVNGQFLLRFVDFGNEELRQYSDLRAIQSEFLILPILAQRCYLKNAVHLPYPLSNERFTRVLNQLLDIDFTLYVKQRQIDGEANSDNFVVGILCELGTTQPVHLLPDLVSEQPPNEIEPEPTIPSAAPQLNLLGVAKKIDSRRTNWLRDEAQSQRLQVRPPALFELTSFVDPHRFCLKSISRDVQQKSKDLHERLICAFRANSNNARQLYRIVPVSKWLRGDIAIAKWSLGPGETEGTLINDSHLFNVNKKNEKLLPLAASEFWRVRLCTLPAIESGLVEEQLVMCYFIDKGVSKSVRVGDLFCMPEMQDIQPCDEIIINTPPLALQCKLARVKPPGGSSQWPTSSLEFVQNECLGKTNVIVGVDAAYRVENPEFPGEDMWLVDIILIYKDPNGLSTYMDLSQLLTESGYALQDNKDGCEMKTGHIPQIGCRLNRTVHQLREKPSQVPISPPLNLPVWRWPDFPAMTIAEDIPVLVITVDSNLTFYCIHRNNEDNYHKDCQSMSQALGSLVTEFRRRSHNAATPSLRRGMHCIFQTSTSEFGRGIVNSVENVFRVSVFAIDSGSVNLFPANKVVPLVDVASTLSSSTESNKVVQAAMKYCLNTNPLVIAGRLENLYPINPTHPNDLNWEEWSFKVWALVKKMVLTRDIRMSVCGVFPPRGDADAVVYREESASDNIHPTEQRMRLPRFDTMLSIRLVSPSFHPDVDMQELGDFLANDESLAYRYDKSDPNEVWLRCPALFGAYTNPLPLSAMEGHLYPVFVPHVATPTEVFLHFYTSHASFPRLQGDDEFFHRLVKANAFLMNGEENSRVMAAARNLDLELSLLGDGACSAKSPDDGIWYRAILRKVRDVLSIVQFVDFGDLHSVPNSDIHEPKFKDVPVACVKVKLFGDRHHSVRGENFFKDNLLDITNDELKSGITGMVWCRFRKVYNDGRPPLVELFKAK